MLRLVHLILGARVNPGVALGVDLDALAPLGKLHAAAGSNHLHTHVVLAARLLAAIADEPRAVGILICHGKMVKDLAILRLGEHLAAAHANGLRRILVLHHPGAHIEEVHMLLDVEVA